MLFNLLANAHLTPEQRVAVASLQEELRKAHEQIRKLESKIKILEEQVAADQIILTRPEFNREVARMLAFDERYGGTSSVLYFDFTGLEGIEARFGPAVAAETTKIIVNALGQHVRRSDIVGRLAVDEFGILLLRCDNANAWKKGRELAGMLAHALETVAGQRVGLDISFGAYTFREEEDVATGLKEAAEVLTSFEKSDYQV